MERRFSTPSWPSNHRMRDISFTTRHWWLHKPQYLDHLPSRVAARDGPMASGKGGSPCHSSATRAPTGIPGQPCEVTDWLAFVERTSSEKQLPSPLLGPRASSIWWLSVRRNVEIKHVARCSRVAFQPRAEPQPTARDSVHLCLFQGMRCITSRGIMHQPRYFR